MNIDKLNVKLRRRGLWEAVDLGFLLARKHFWPLLLTWLVGALPVAIVFGAIFYKSPLWMVFCVWLFKPLYENVMLNRLSRMIFGQYAPLKPVIKSYIAANKGRFFYALIISRLTLNRSFAAPVSLLEGQKGKPRKLRLTQLSMSMQNVTQFMTILLFLIEFGLIWALFICFVALVPTDFVDHNVSAFIANPLFPMWVFSVLSFFTMALIAPFYVCAGFALYLSRRTELEAWDIELNFKLLLERIESQASKRSTFSAKSNKPNLNTDVENLSHSNVQKGGASTSILLAIVVGCFCLFALPPHTVMASQLNQTEQVLSKNLTQKQVKKEIRDILSGDEFGGETTQYRWQKKPQKSEKKRKNNFDYDDVFDVISSALKGMAAVLKLTLVAVLLVGLGYVFSHANGLLSGVSTFFNRNEELDVPNHLFGLDMKKDSLPDNISAQAKALLEKRQYRQALALLLRGSFVHVLHKQHVPIPASATEQECLRLFAGQLSQQQYDYLQRLIKQWILIAYAHETPEHSILLELCEQWHTIYEQPQKLSDAPVHLETTAVHNSN